MRHRLAIGMTAAAVLILATLLPAQQGTDAPEAAKQGVKGGKGGKGKGKRGPSLPAPRTADGKVSFGPGPGQKGVWQGPVVGLTTQEPQDPLAIADPRAPKAPYIGDVPFQPWARELYTYRRSNQTADDPHVRCKSSGGARLYHTPYGFEIIQVDDMQRIFVAGVGGPHSYRTIYMDGRPHPSDLDATFHGHSVGHWEGDDKLVVDTVGFNTRFWWARDGYPHTPALHIVETFERPDYDTLYYNLTIDDPGAYTKPWTTGFTINWGANNEMYEFVCQENNRDARHMYTGGDQ